MANYTITLNELLKLNPTLRSELFPQWQIFDNDETHKANLEDDIVNYFLLREIGHETADSFVHYFQRKFKEHIVEYNRLGAAQAKVAEIGWFSNYSEERDLTTNIKSTDSENKVNSQTQESEGGNSVNETINETSTESSTGNQEGTTSGTSSQSGSSTGNISKEGSSTNEQETTNTLTGSGTRNNEGTNTNTNDAKTWVAPISQFATEDENITSRTLTTDTGSNTNNETTSNSENTSNITDGTTSNSETTTQTTTDELSGTTSSTNKLDVSSEAEGEVNTTKTSTGSNNQTINTDGTITTTGNGTKDEIVSEFKEGRTEPIQDLYIRYIDAIKSIDEMWHMWLEPCFMSIF